MGVRPLRKIALLSHHSVESNKSTRWRYRQTSVPLEPIAVSCSTRQVSQRSGHLDLADAGVPDNREGSPHLAMSVVTDRSARVRGAPIDLLSSPPAAGGPCIGASNGDVYQALPAYPQAAKTIVLRAPAANASVNQLKTSPPASCSSA